MWTDDLLTERFDRIDERFDRIDARMGRLEAEMSEMRREMHAGFASLQRQMFHGIIAICTWQTAVLAALVAHAL